MTEKQKTELAITIEIHYSEMNDGYMYTIHNCEPDRIEDVPDGFDGGLCTGTMVNALGMATDQAQTLAQKISEEHDTKELKPFCNVCGLSIYIENDACTKCKSTDIGYTD